MPEYGCSGYPPTAVDFSRTHVRALVRVADQLPSDGLVDYILELITRVDAGTPVDDPLGDYTRQIFQRAEAA